MNERERNRSNYEHGQDRRYTYRDDPREPEYEYRRAHARDRDYGDDERYDRSYGRPRDERDDYARSFAGPRDSRRFGGGAYAGTRGFGGYEERNYAGPGGRDDARDADERRLPGPYGWYGDRQVNRELADDQHEQYTGHEGGHEHSHPRWSQQIRHAGQELARKVKRVFRGPKGYKRSDERIREDVNDRLSQQEHFDPSDVEVSVANAEVTLTGFVRSRDEKFIAEEISDDVSGVTEVHNQLRVRREQTAPGVGAPQTLGGSDALRSHNARAR